MKRLVLIWLATFLGCCALCTLAFLYIDIPVARLVFPWSGHLEPFGKGLGSAIFLSIEAVALLVLAYVRISRGHLSRLGSAVALASLASICAYAINTSVLKTFFGVLGPGEMIYGAPHSFDFFHGTIYGSFPSGHMALAGAAIGVFMWLYPRFIAPLAGLLLVGAAMLVLGNWHFVSDVIAGAFVGVSAGAVAAKLWIVHNSRSEI